MRCAVQGPARPQVRRAIGEVESLKVLTADRPDVARLTGGATEWLHQQRDAGVVLHHQRQHHLVEVGAMVPAVAAGDMHDMGVGLLRTDVAASGVNAGASEMGQGRGQPQALGSRGGHETVEFCRPMLVQPLQGAPQAIISEVLGCAPGASSRRVGLL